MSNEAQAVALHHSQASGTDKVIMIAIANYAGEDGAWCSIPTLAKIANVTEESARRAVRRLEALGEIETEVNGGYGKQLKKPKHTRTNRYEVTLRCPEWCDHSMQHRDTREFNSGPSSTSAPRQRRPDADATPGPSSTSGEPVYEPKPIGNPLPEPRESRASATDPSTDQSDDYASRQPGQQIAQLAQQMNHQPVKRPDYSAGVRPRGTLPPAGKPPRPAPPPPKPPPLPPDQQARNHAAARLPCPAGRGTHKLPATAALCMMCGTTTDQILDNQEQL